MFPVQQAPAASFGGIRIPIRVLGPNTSQASAFKVVYAGLTKGLQGLFVELLMGARRFGLLDEMRAQYEESFPGLLDKVSASIVGLRIHAGRRAEEMDELKRTFNHHGMESFMAPAAQKVLEAIAALGAGKASDSGARQGDLPETLELFYEKGLLRMAPARKKFYSGPLAIAPDSWYGVQSTQLREGYKSVESRKEATPVRIGRRRRFDEGA